MAGLLEAPQRKIRLGSLCGDVRWAHAGTDALVRVHTAARLRRARRAAMLQRARGKRRGGRGRMARARGSRDAEWSSIGINAEGAPRFSERDCEASSLPNPLETNFQKLFASFTYAELDTEPVGDALRRQVKLQSRHAPMLSLLDVELKTTPHGCF
jgi:hypothetical protein